MTFTFPAGWTADAESRAFDLVCREEARELSAGVFSYTREGAAMPFEPSEALDFHVEDFCARLEDAGEPVSYTHLSTAWSRSSSPRRAT